MLKKLELTFEDFRQLQAYCVEKGILFLSTPFDEESLDFLVDDLQIPYIKISSGDLTNFPFLYQIAKKNKPIIISTGMATMAEAEKSVAWLRQHTDSEIVVLHCTTNYPCP
jgi:sialic acid synthase SpsE